MKKEKSNENEKLKKEYELLLKVLKNKQTALINQLPRIVSNTLKKEIAQEIEYVSTQFNNLQKEYIEFIKNNLIKK